MAVNAYAFGPDQVIGAGFLRSRGGALRSGKLNIKFEDYTDQASIGGPLALFHDYYVTNPADPRTFTRNGIQLAESRESVIYEMRNFPHWATDPVDKVRALLELYSANMHGSSMSMVFLPLHNVDITQESRLLQAYQHAALMYFAQRPCYSPVYTENVLEAAAYALSPFFGNTVWEINRTVDQLGAPNPVTVRHTCNARFWDNIQAILATKEAMTQAPLAQKGADAILEATAPSVLAYSQWRYYANPGNMAATVPLDTTPAGLLAVRYLMELVQLMRPITQAETVLPLYGTGPTYIDAEALDKMFDAVQLVYSMLPTNNYRRIPLAYRYLVRGGNQRQYTIAGTPEYVRVDYGLGPVLNLGGRGIGTFRAQYNLTGATPTLFRYTNPLVNPAAAATAFRTTVPPNEIVLSYSEEIQLVQPGTAPQQASQTAQDYVESMRIINEQLHDQFYLPRNWTARAGLGATVLGGIQTLLAGKIPGMTPTAMQDIVPLNGAKIADAGEVKASIPLRDYSLKITPGDNVKVVGQPVMRWDRPLQARLAGYWMPYPADMQEVGTGWYVR